MDMNTFSFHDTFGNITKVRHSSLLYVAINVIYIFDIERDAGERAGKINLFDVKT